MQITCRSGFTKRGDRRRLVLLRERQIPEPNGALMSDRTERTSWLERVSAGITTRLATMCLEDPVERVALIYDFSGADGPVLPMVAVAPASWLAMVTSRSPADLADTWRCGELPLQLSVHAALDEDEGLVEVGWEVFEPNDADLREEAIRSLMIDLARRLNQMSWPGVVRAPGSFVYAAVIGEDDLVPNLRAILGESFARALIERWGLEGHRPRLEP